MQVIHGVDLSIYHALQAVSGYDGVIKKLFLESSIFLETDGVTHPSSLTDGSPFHDFPAAAREDRSV
jgi:hypothetical protein